MLPPGLDFETASSCLDRQSGMQYARLQVIILPKCEKSRACCVSMADLRDIISTKKAPEFEA